MKYTHFLLLALLGLFLNACGSGEPSAADLEAEAEAEKIELFNTELEQQVDKVEESATELKTALDSLDVLFPELED